MIHVIAIVNTQIKKKEEKNHENLDAMVELGEGTAQIMQAGKNILLVAGSFDRLLNSGRFIGCKQLYPLYRTS
jgi:hypothetical protein